MNMGKTKTNHKLPIFPTVCTSSMILLQVPIFSLCYFCDRPDVIMNRFSFTTVILLALLSNYNSLEFFKGKKSFLFSRIEPENISASQFPRWPPMRRRRIHGCNSKEDFLICQLITMVKVKCSEDKHTCIKA